MVSMERTNLRELRALPEPIDLATLDLSFISLRLVLPAVRDLLADEGRVVALVKPQFEAGQGGRPARRRRHATRAICASACCAEVARDAADAPGFDAHGRHPLADHRRRRQRRVPGRSSRARRREPERSRGCSVEARQRAAGSTRVLRCCSMKRRSGARAGRGRAAGHRLRGHRGRRADPARAGAGHDAPDRQPADAGRAARRGSRRPPSPRRVAVEPDAGAHRGGARPLVRGRPRARPTAEDLARELAAQRRADRRAGAGGRGPERGGRDLMSARIGFAFNPYNDRGPRRARARASVVRRRTASTPGMRRADAVDGIAAELTSTDLVCVLGGDGTFLRTRARHRRDRACRRWASTSGGSASWPRSRPTAWSARSTRSLAGDYVIEDRFRIEASIVRPDERRRRASTRA